MLKKVSAMAGIWTPYLVIDSPATYPLDHNTSTYLVCVCVVFLLFVFVSLSLALFTVIDPCIAGPCQNGGACTSSGLTYTCQCPSTHEGTNCETGKTKLPENIHLNLFVSLSTNKFQWFMIIVIRRYFYFYLHVLMSEYPWRNKLWNR